MSETDREIDMLVSLLDGFLPREHWPQLVRDIRALVRRAAAEERGACAKVAEDHKLYYGRDLVRINTEGIAAAIRARGSNDAGRTGAATDRPLSQGTTWGFPGFRRGV